MGRVGARSGASFQRRKRGAVYVECEASEVPQPRGDNGAGRIRWDRPPGRQGETFAVDFGGPALASYPHVAGAPWKRVTDYTIPVGEPGREVFYRLTDEPRSISTQGSGGTADEQGQEATTR